MVLRDVLQQPFTRALAVALEQFVWQGAALGLALAALVRLLRPDARRRYLMGVACLAAMALAPLATLVAFGGRAPVVGAPFSAPLLQAPARAWAGASGEALASPWSAPGVVVSLWAIGVLALSLRLVGGWVMTRRLVARTRDRASAEIRWLADRLSQDLALGRHIEIFESPTVVVPMLIGWIAPVIILPAAALAGLTPAQVETLIAHELAHARRHDYLVNLLQSVVETLLFFHPAVWWVSRDVRESREQCCDDLVVGLCDRVVYASALADLAAIVRGPRLALAATDGSLVSRVRRILGGGGDSRRGRQEWVAAAVLAVLVVGAVPIALASARAAAPAPAVPARVAVGLQEPAVALSPAQAAPAVQGATPASVTPIADAGAEPLKLEEQAATQPAVAQDDELQAAQLELKRDLEALRARLDLSQGDQNREAQVKALLEKLRAIDERARSLDQVDRDTMAEAAAKLERAKAIAGEQEDAVKMKLARDRDVVAALEKLKADREAEVADGADKLAKLSAQWEARVQPGEGGWMLVRVPGKDTAEFDPKEIQSVIEPALGAGPNDVSVVGTGVAHPGRVEWRDGLTVEAALKAAGAPPIAGADHVVRRLSELRVTFGAGGPRVNGRVDDVEAGTVLHPGDVLVVSPRVKK